ncbi:MAG: bifunctional DNA-formamidopyrimidine glycosylase/DNA-(apurinic or apyrimidinic site) lyase [Pirellulaceae bacterium]|nr:bifunctional DNA-formamidopyrimidine glycosylase/DNA-(apurinic or apyrimidinic site) lyase [Pirellulaceae bacterium]
MPELPEVETMRRGLLPCIGGEVVTVSKPRSKYRPIAIEPPLPKLRQKLLGCRIMAVERLGKRVVIRFDSGDLLLLQPKMAGLVLVGLPPNQAHARLVIELSGVKATPIIYWDQRGLGTIKLWASSEMQSYLESGAIGPDALAISFEDFYRRFSASHREVKPTLLEQDRVAGIGNLYAAEILHRARIHPQCRAYQLSKSAWRKIFDSSLFILQEAIEYEGSTLGDGSYRNAKNNPGSYQNAHQVYDRAGQRCRQCRRGKIERIVQAQRSTFFCPCCQRLPKMA